MNPLKDCLIKSLVEKSSSKEAQNDLAVLDWFVLSALVLGLLETTDAGVGGQIQLSDALDELLKLAGLNAFEADAGVFDCDNKKAS